MRLYKLPFKILILPIVVVVLMLLIGVGGKTAGYITNIKPVFLVGFATIGAMLSCAAVYLFYVGASERRRLLATVGVITGYQTSFSEHNWHPKISFTYEGKRYTAITRTHRRLLPEEGEQITVLFDPNNPAVAYEPGLIKFYLIPIVVSLLGTILLFIGTFSLIVDG